MSKLQEHPHNILHQNYHISKDCSILLIYDTESSLAKLLSEKYMKEIKSHQHKAINFLTVDESVVEEAVASLPAHTLENFEKRNFHYFKLNH